METNLEKCPCGSLETYTNCCGKIHKDISAAQTAEQLMRSRYTAFVKANGDYLQLSHHSKTRPNSREQKELLIWTKSVEWLKLEVLQTEKGKERDTEGSVYFKAYFQTNGKVEIIEEKSAFVRENGHWVYFGIIN